MFAPSCRAGEPGLAAFEAIMDRGLRLESEINDPIVVVCLYVGLQMYACYLSPHWPGACRRYVPPTPHIGTSRLLQWSWHEKAQVWQRIYDLTNHTVLRFRLIARDLASSIWGLETSGSFRTLNKKWRVG